MKIIIRFLAVVLLPVMVWGQQIDSFYPTICAGGIGDVLTINGSGFGTMDSADRVYIGSQFAVPPVEVLSWTDTQITCRVHGNAQSGRVKVLNDGVQVQSSNNINVRYTIYNAYNQVTNSYQVPKLQNQYVFQVNGFSQTGLNRLQSAIEAWGCATGINFAYEVSDVNWGLNNDNVSSIYVAPGAGGAGTLPRWKECGAYTYLNEIDIRFDDATPPYYYILHELGHAAGLSHHFGGSVMGGSNSVTDLDIEAVAKVFELGNIPTDCTSPMDYADCYTLSIGDFIPSSDVLSKVDYYTMDGKLVRSVNAKYEFPEYVPMVMESGIYILNYTYESGRSKAELKVINNE